MPKFDSPTNKYACVPVHICQSMATKFSTVGSISKQYKSATCKLNLDITGLLDWFSIKFNTDGFVLASKSVAPLQSITGRSTAKLWRRIYKLLYCTKFTLCELPGPGPGTWVPGHPVLTVQVYYRVDRTMSSFEQLYSQAYI